MATFVLDPEMRLRERELSVRLRTVHEATDFAQRMAMYRRTAAWMDVSKLLDRVRTEDEAIEAAVALEMLLTRENLLLSNDELPVLGIGRPASRSDSDRAASISDRATSMIFESALAEASST